MVWRGHQSKYGHFFIGGRFRIEEVVISDYEVFSIQRHTDTYWYISFH